MNDIAVINIDGRPLQWLYNKPGVCLVLMANKDGHNAWQLLANKANIRDNAWLTFGTLHLMALPKKKKKC